MIIFLKPVGWEDYHFLYSLLKEKTPEQNISHREMPTWREHLEFNNAKPYEEDYIIMVDGKPCGRLYLTKVLNEIGIHIKDEERGKGIGGAVIDFLKTREVVLHANISPKNEASIRLFEKKGFKLVQQTYRFD